MYERPFSNTQDRVGRRGRTHFSTKYLRRATLSTAIDVRLPCTWKGVIYFRPKLKSHPVVFLKCMSKKASAEVAQQFRAHASWR